MGASQKKQGPAVFEKPICSGATSRCRVYWRAICQFI